MTPGDSTIVVTEERPLPDDAPVPLVSEDPPPAT